MAPGIVLIILALFLYGAGLFYLRKRNVADKTIVYLFSAGYLADMAGTVGMMAGGNSESLTLHEALGYSALILMCALIVILWRYRLLDENEPLPRYVRVLAHAVCGWWLAVFVTGCVLRIFGVNPVIG